MLLTKLVIRIMDADGQLLGWAEAQGEARGDGKLWVKDPTTVFFEHDGEMKQLSVHWCDVNVEIRSLIEQKTVKFGEMVVLPGEWEAITVGPAAGGLPPVTVTKPVTIAMLPGSLGARGN